MLIAIALHEVAGSDVRLREALRAADLPTDEDGFEEGAAIVFNVSDLTTDHDHD